MQKIINMNWIDENLVLEGERVILRPMQHGDIDELIAAGSDSRIWQFGTVAPEEAALRTYYEEALENKRQGTQFPFVIFDKQGNIIGTTRFGEISPGQRKLEIGWTWYKPELWGKGYNEECKYLLLTYCFDVLKTVRVELKTSENNYRSRRAILRLGCAFEGVRRNHIIREGVMRNTAMFSMLPEEWKMSRQRLKFIVESKYAGTYTYEPDSIHTVYKDYLITTYKHLMQPGQAHKWLSEKSYWLPGVPFHAVKTAFENSFCIAILHEGVQVGYARFITDYTVFAFLADVYVEEAHQGQGLGKKMMELLLSLSWVKNVRRLALMTKDAHGLYAQYGFAPATPETLERYMEKRQALPWE